MLVALSKADQNAAAIDPWTGVHLAAGLAAGLMDARFVPVFSAAVVYEVLEHYFESSEFGQRTFSISGPEIGPNVAIDIGIFALGWWLGHQWNQTGA
jgi:hypothetical protein